MCSESALRCTTTTSGFHTFKGVISELLCNSHRIHVELMQWRNTSWQQVRFLIKANNIEIRGILMIRIWMSFAILVSSVLIVQGASAGCPCNSQAGAGYSAPMMESFPGSTPYGPAIEQMPYSPSIEYGADQLTEPVSPPHNSPPGTIGRTYQLPSRPVPVEVHPRSGMIDVYVPGAKEVIAHDVNGYRTKDLADGFRDAKNPDVWHFTSEPLLPGLPHIYRIEATYEDDRTPQARFVRLIRGRLVMLEF